MAWPQYSPEGGCFAGRLVIFIATNNSLCTTAKAFVVPTENASRAAGGNDAIIATQGIETTCSREIEPSELDAGSQLSFRKSSASDEAALLQSVEDKLCRDNCDLFDWGSFLVLLFGDVFSYCF